jgi:glyoxylase-like metal-dependent hydrolase (beta-lactamase superfamily II)
VTDISVGTFQVSQVIEQVAPLAPARAFFPDLTQEMLEVCQRELPPGHLTGDGTVLLSFHAYVVRTGRHVILVDTCCGNDKDLPGAPQFSNLKTNFLPALAAANVVPEQVDFVMCTHLHFDHVGWNTRWMNGTWCPTFPNAKYIISKKEYEHWDQLYQSGLVNLHTASFKQSVKPIARQALLVEDDFGLEDGVWVEPCPGHTPGNFVIHLVSMGDHGLITGDVIHHQLQLRYPSLSSRADDDRDLARVTRTALIERCADTSRLLLPGHFPAPSVGRIVSASSGGYRYVAVA